MAFWADLSSTDELMKRSMSTATLTCAASSCAVQFNQQQSGQFNAIPKEQD
jgi:hypothetical protein